MTLPRIITSPSVSPSRANGRHRLRIEHVQRFQRAVAHALARLLHRLLGRGERVPRLVPVVDDGRAVTLGQSVKMRDVETRLFHRGEHRLGRRRRGGEEFDNVRQRLLFVRRRIEQRRHHDRRAAKMRHFVIGDCVVHCGRAHRAQAHMRAGDDRDRPREAPAVTMKHRQGPQIDRMLGHGTGHDIADREQMRAAMVIDDAFGISRRARRVIERDRVPLVIGHFPGVAWITLRDEVLVFDCTEPLACTFVFRIVIVDHQRLRFAEGERFLHHLRIFAVGDHDFRVGVIKREGNDRRVESVLSVLSTAWHIGTP